MHTDVVSVLAIIILNILCEYENEVNKTQLINVQAIFFYNTMFTSAYHSHGTEKWNGLGRILRGGNNIAKYEYCGTMLCNRGSSTGIQGYCPVLKVEKEVLGRPNPSSSP